MAISAPVQEAIRAHMKRGRERRAERAQAVTQAVGDVLALVMMPTPGVPTAMQKLVDELEKRHG